jgi:adenosylcobinamide kinase/adenosylcobinamide-phosphate guanylyltransferase
MLDGPVAAAYEALARRPGPAVVVSDEVGLGIVPMDANARLYRDLVGIAHQRLAAVADEAYLFVAGLPVMLKGPR